MNEDKLPNDTNGHRWNKWVFSASTLICCERCGFIYNPKSLKLCPGPLMVGPRSLDRRHVGGRTTRETEMPDKMKPVAHLVWLQGRRGPDDVEDYYEVSRPGDKSVDGSDPFPVYAADLGLLSALQGYMSAVTTMNAAMKDGINVHGAVAEIIGWEDMANAAIAKAIEASNE